MLALRCLKIPSFSELWRELELCWRRRQGCSWRGSTDATKALFGFRSSASDHLASSCNHFTMGGSISQRKREDDLAVETRLVRVMQQRAASAKTSVKSFDSVLMKFPKIDRAFEQVRDIFKKFDKNKTGTIDLEQLKACFRELQVEFTEEEVKVFYEESDIDCNRRISFKEFIIVLALVYLLGKPLSSDAKSRIGLPELEWSFETIEDAFVFFDKNGDGYVTREEMIEAIHESSHGKNTSQDSIGVERFEEMDWDRDGRVTFKEFLFAFTGWVGIEDDDDVNEAEDEAER